MTGNDHTDAPHGDVITGALRSPALPSEQVDEAAVVANMVGALTTAPVPSSLRRHRRVLAFAAVTVASLGVGGIIAANPGGFRPLVNGDKPPASPIFDDSVPVPAPDDLDNDDLDNDDLDNDDLDNDDVDNDDLDNDDLDDLDDLDLDDDVDGGGTDRITTDPDFDCAEGDNANHGQTVSSAAKDLGPNNAAAQSQCGKPVGSSTDDSNGGGGTDRITTDPDFDCAEGDNANHGQTVSSVAKDLGPNNAAAQSQCGKPVGSGNGNGNSDDETDDTGYGKTNNGNDGTPGPPASTPGNPNPGPPASTPNNGNGNGNGNTTTTQPAG